VANEALNFTDEASGNLKAPRGSGSMLVDHRFFLGFSASCVLTIVREASLRKKIL